MISGGIELINLLKYALILEEKFSDDSLYGLDMRKYGQLHILNLPDYID